MPMCFAECRWMYACNASVFMCAFVSIAVAVYGVWCVVCSVWCVMQKMMRQKQKQVANVDETRPTCRQHAKGPHTVSQLSSFFCSFSGPFSGSSSCFLFVLLLLLQAYCSSSFSRLLLQTSSAAYKIHTLVDIIIQSTGCVDRIRRCLSKCVQMLRCRVLLSLFAMRWNKRQKKV